MNLVAGLRRRASLVLLVIAAGVAYGVSALTSLPSGIYPDVDFPRLVVVAHVGDLPPEGVQVVATRPLEEALATVPGVRRIRSRTIRGAVELSAQFADGQDMWRALQIAEAQVGAARGDLPPGSELTVERVTPTALPIVTFNVSGQNVNPKVLRETADLVIRPALTRVAGVGAVEVQGGDVREIEVVLDPRGLAFAHLTPSKIADKIAAYEVVTAVGRAAEAHQVQTVLVASEPQTKAELEALPVASGGDGPLPLSAVARVDPSGAEDRTMNVSGPGGDVVVIGISRTPGASTPDVVASARAVVGDLIRTKQLPAGVEVTTVYDQSILIDDAMAGVRDAILIGIALSLIVLAVFLRDLRAGAAAAAAVPVTLLITFGAMKLFGQTLNLMSLGGLAVAIGLVVDDAIVIVEAIVARLEEGMEVTAAAEHGTRDLFAAVVGTTLTTVVVFAPLALIGGVVGSFFGALAVTLSAAVLLSLAISLSLVPLLSSWLLKPRKRHRDPGAAPGGRLSRAYAAAVRRVVRHPIISVVAMLAIGTGGWLASRKTATGFLPSMDEGAFVLDFFLPAGSSLEVTDQIARKIDHVLLTTPSVASFTRRTGAEMGPAAATQQNRGDILVRLKPRSQRGPIEAEIDQVRERAHHDVPEADIEFVQVLQDVLDDLSGNPRPIEVKIFGPDPKVLQSIAAAAAAKLDGLGSIEDLYSGIEGDVPTLRIAVRPRVAAGFGLTPGDISADLEASLAGRVAGHVRVGDRNLGVRVHMPDDLRFNPAAIAALPLGYGPVPVPLATLAEVAPTLGPSVLTRENLRPVLIMSAAVHGSDLGGATDDVRARLAGLPVPAGYSVEIGGQQASAKQTQRDLLGVFGMGIALVLAILLVQLGSLRMALVVLLGAPLALVGAIVTLLVMKIPLNASSLMGCVLLAGLVVKNGILLLERAHLEAEAGGDFAEALARAGARRLRPIIMTTAATIVGLFPLALGLGAGAELQRPLAVATIGGLILSTLVTLFAVPALAYALAGKQHPRPPAPPAPPVAPAEPTPAAG